MFKKNYKLIWSDEFNYEGELDKDKWMYSIGGHGWGNNQAQFYTDRLENVWVKDGRLIITGKKESYKGLKYTSGRISTYGKKSFQYGRFEIKAKMPKGKGSWPAIWMMPDSFHEGVSWPLCGEIDIMEHLGRMENTIHVSLHTGKYNHTLKNQMTHYEEVEGVTERFIEYAIDWTEDYIEFFVDGKSFAKFEKGGNGHDTDEGGWPFDQPFYLIINNAIGGYWGGDIDDSSLPQTLEIEYVRVYEIL